MADNLLASYIQNMPTAQQSFDREAFQVPANELALQKGQYEMKRLNALEQARQEALATQASPLARLGIQESGLQGLGQAQEMQRQQVQEEQKYMAQAARRVLAAKTPWAKKNIWKAERARAQAMGFDVSDDPEEYDPSIEGQLQLLAESAPQTAEEKISQFVGTLPEEQQAAAMIAPTEFAKGQVPQNIKPIDALKLQETMLDIQKKQAELDQLEKTGGLDIEEIFNQESKLRADYQKQSQQFGDVSRSYQRVIDSATNPSAAGDLALIFNYMKILDPGSTVREGEFATAQNAGGLDDRTRSLYNSVINGTRLSEAQRADFVARAGMLYKGQEELQQGIDEQYKTLADRYKLNSENILIGGSRASVKQPTKKPTQDEIRAELARRGVK